jgi:hypothetical protein
MSNQTGPSKPKGCFFYGCLSLAILGLVMALFLAVGFYFAKRTVNTMVTTYTDAAPVQLENAAYSRAQMEILQKRIGGFRQALDKGEGNLELVLTAEDLNALIAENPDLKGRVLVSIDDDQVKGDVSIPLKDFGPVKLQGRHLNGSATFRVQLVNGILDVRLDQVKVKDKPLPTFILSELKKHNLAQEAQTSPEFSEVVERLDSLEVTGGKVIITSKAEAAPDTTPEPPAPAPAETPAPPQPVQP